MIIEVKNISKAFGKNIVLKDISFSAQSGECIGIIGANGCGKSTLFSILAGVQAGNGDFLADGKSLVKNTKLRNKSVGYIPQGTPLIDELSAYDNLRLWYKKEDLEEISEESIIKRFGVDKFLKTAVRKMSGGMKKRVSIACSVAHNPQIIIMDEPTAALDIICKQEIKNYIEFCRKNGNIVILSTHESEELKLCDKIYLLKNGVLERFDYSGNPEEIAESIK